MITCPIGGIFPSGQPSLLHFPVVRTDLTESRKGQFFMETSLIIRWLPGERKESAHEVL